MRTEYPTEVEYKLDRIIEILEKIELAISGPAESRIPVCEECGGVIRIFKAISGDVEISSCECGVTAQVRRAKRHETDPEVDHG